MNKKGESLLLCNIKWKVVSLIDKVLDEFVKKRGLSTRNTTFPFFLFNLTCVFIKEKIPGKKKLSLFIVGSVNRSHEYIFAG